MTVNHTYYYIFNLKLYITCCHWTVYYIVTQLGNLLLFKLNTVIKNQPYVIDIKAYILLANV